MPEGTVFFPDEPILRVTAPLPEAQFVETRLVNLLHFQSVIASKAARMTLAAPGKSLIDYGLRRARGGARRARQLHCRVQRHSDGCGCRRIRHPRLRHNRRLAPDVYLGVVPLILKAGGNLSIGGKGAITDWLVEMVRLPAERMLDRCLARGDWHYAHIHVLAARLGHFAGSLTGSSRRCSRIP